MCGLTRRNCLTLGLALGMLAGAPYSFAQEDKATKAETPPAAAAPAALPIPAVAATVNGENVYLGEIEAGLSDVLKLRHVNPEGIEHARAGLLRDIINKRLIEQSLVKDESYLSPAVVDREMHKLESRMKDNRTTLEQFAAARGVTPAVARHEISWPLVWNKYLEKHLADALEGFFKEHHKDLDGTQVRASHILLRAVGARETKSQLLRRAEKLRADIEAKKVTFEEAAEKYSAGPSRRKGGDLGFFPRYGVMAEGFSKAAFALEKGELSQPVTTNFGTHLIRATDVKPGNVQWTEVVPQIKALASKQLFDELAREQLETAKIEFTGKAAYFKPGTDELVLPKTVAEK